MQRKFRIVGVGALLLLAVYLIVVDRRIKAKNAQMLEVTNEYLMHSRQSIESDLTKVRKISSANAASSAAASALMQQYARTEQSYVGIQAFKMALPKFRPQLIGPLAGQPRSTMTVHLDALRMNLDGHASTLMSKESIEKKSGEGLVAELRRNFGPIQ